MHDIARYNEMLSYSGCMACSARRPFENNDCIPKAVMLDGPEDLPPLMIVLSRPTPLDHQTGSILSGKDRDTMELWLSNAVNKIGVQRVYLTNAVKCDCGARDPRDSEIYACSKTHLVNEIELLEPKVILACGHRAIKALFPAFTKTQVQEAVHQCYPDTCIDLPNGVWKGMVLTTMHPGFYESKPTETSMRDQSAKYFIQAYTENLKYGKIQA